MKAKAFAALFIINLSFFKNRYARTRIQVFILMFEKFLELFFNNCDSRLM